MMVYHKNCCNMEHVKSKFTKLAARIKSTPGLTRPYNNPRIITPFLRTGGQTPGDISSFNPSFETSCVWHGPMICPATMAAIA